MNKKMILALFSVIFVIGLLLGIYAGTRPDTQEGSKEITVVVLHSDGTEKNFQWKTDAVYLSEVLLEKELVTGSDSEYGLTIESVDGETADFTTGNAYWAVYIGDEYATVGVSGIALEDGGVYKLAYETF